MNHSDYLKILNPRKRAEVVERCRHVLITLGWQFEAIAVTGLSGNLVGVDLATLLNKNIMIVRKKDEDNHGKLVEATQPLQDDVRYIIVDDFISNGNTVKRIHAKIREEYTQRDYLQDTPTFFRAPLCVGVLLHASAQNNEMDLRKFDYESGDYVGDEIPLVPVYGILNQPTP